ncbi:uncharacterized protein LOC129723594 [Wyeomyia smithii]|uniref:uncharacterized protein LOC129723594 n=1 Tax=Wyeomyia smithii TaxID=174621 RepID=UPI002467FCAB|nr:uncharacterized protein LOC129723594 [Wyeomyia smithii]
MSENCEDPDCFKGSKWFSTRECGRSHSRVFDNNYKAAVRAYQNFMEGFQLVLSENERKMNAVLHRRSFPLWFQELSDEQVDAMNLLLSAIRDDIDEDTVFRCRRLIKRLGVYPMCPTATFREALIMCRGNDLSFLWFLLELFYSGKALIYTNNERLIMSAMCHLDMMTTLGGLEGILPPACPSYPRCVLTKRKSPRWPTHARYCSPYLEPQNVPRPSVKCYPACTFEAPVPFCISRYAMYQDPDFIIPNEASRWFARQTQGHQTSFGEPKERVKRTIPLSSACGSAELIVKELLNNQIALMVGQQNEQQELCRKHQDMDKRRRKLMGLLAKRTEVREKIMNDVAKAADRKRKEEQVARDRQMIKLLLRKVIDDSILTAMLTPRGNCPECWEAFEQQRKLRDGTRCSCDSERGVFCLRSMLAVNQSFGQKYFKCCRGSIPYQFDYKKILEDDSNGKPVCPVKKAIRLALGMEDGDFDEGEAIGRCLKEMWRCELRLWNEKFLKGREEASEKKTEIDMLDYEFVDSKDPIFLQKLLKRALLKLCEDPKYVLATFPDAHKLPFLNSWIQHRYGVRISQGRKETLLQQSKYFWNWLIPRVTAMRWPVCKDLGMQGRVNWNYKRKLEKTAQEQLSKFYRKFKKVQIQEGHLYWHTMDPYHTNVDRFRQIFLDYLPNCEPLIGPMVRPWHPFEFRPSAGVLPCSESKTRCK